MVSAVLEKREMVSRNVRFHELIGGGARVLPLADLRARGLDGVCGTTSGQCAGGLRQGRVQVAADRAGLLERIFPRESAASVTYRTSE